MTPNMNLMQYLRAVWIFLWEIFIFLFPGYTQHILKVWRKSISNFSKYSKINSVGSFLTPGWATVCAKKTLIRNTKEHKIVLWIFNYKDRCKASVPSSFSSGPKLYFCPTCLGSTSFQYSNAVRQQKLCRARVFCPFLHDRVKIKNFICEVN